MRPSRLAFGLAALPLLAGVACEDSPVIDCFRAAHPERGDNEGTGSGFQAKNTSGARIDWTACSRNWEVRQAQIVRAAREGRTPSDHFPVTVVLKRK